MSTVVRTGDRTAPTHQALPRLARARERNGTGVVPTSRLMELISCPSPKPTMTREQTPTAKPEVDFALIAKMIKPIVADVAPMRSVRRRLRDRSIVPENEPRNKHDKSNPDCLSCKCQYAETKGRRDPMNVQPAPVRDMVTSQMLELAWIRSLIRRSYSPRYRNDQRVEKYFDNRFQASVTRPTRPPAWLDHFLYESRTFRKISPRKRYSQSIPIVETPQSRRHPAKRQAANDSGHRAWRSGRPISTLAARVEVKTRS
jgi:hypothetical protein